MIRELKAHGKHCTVAISPDGKHVATGSYNSSAKLWDISTGALVKTLISHSKEIRQLAFSADGKLLVTASDDKSARLWEVPSGKVLLSLDGNHAGGVCCAALSPGFATRYFYSDSEAVIPPARLIR
ncbi:WD40-repeat-containing domain protein [Pavlovales sp. CCMP2436]|nr:WD40-repeat-containing domain protein [Pavlovales sp. CCMP2436]